MKYIKYQRLAQDAKDIPDGEIFVVYTEEKASPFIVTKETHSVWAFAFKMKGEVTSSDWGRHDADAEAVKHLQRQIMYAKKNGWSGTGTEKIDEHGEMLPVYRCVYCRVETQDVQGACECRGGKKKSVIELI